MEESRLEIPGITDSSTLTRLARARTYEYYCRLVEDTLAGRCPFCEVDRKHNRVVFESDHILCWHCTPPEKNTRLHFLIVPKRHVKGILGLSVAEWNDVWTAYFHLQAKYSFTSAGILIRDGDATLSAGTQEHLHIHIMVPDGTGRVESPFYKGREDDERCTSRAIVFEKVRRGTPLPSLSPEEALVFQDKVVR